MAVQCKATAKSTGVRCTRPVQPGQLVCRFHGGASPQAKSAAAVRLLEADVAQALAKLDVPPVTDPLEELGRLAGIVVAWRDVMAHQVNELTSLRYEGEMTGEQLRAEVLLWERSLNRCATVLGMIAKLNLDERLVRIDERRMDLVVRAYDAGLAAAGIDGDQARLAREHVARQLRKVAG